MNSNKRLAIFIMGVSGVGKSTIGKLLAKQLSIPFFDGDDYHPEKNKKKMADGHPLDDDDRYDWLLNLNKLANEETHHNSCIIACSALKESYRELLKKDIEARVKWILLYGSFNQILGRIQQRTTHFMPSSLLKSQFDALENPIEALKINIKDTPQKIIALIVDELHKKSEFGLVGTWSYGEKA